MSGHLSSYEGHLGNLHEAWQGNTDTSQGEGMSESLLETLGKVLVPRLIWTVGLTSL